MGAAENVFEFVCRSLESSADLDRLEARGTVRIALKAAGLDAKGVTSEQMEIVLEKVLPPELTKRGIEDAESVCNRIAIRMKSRTWSAPASEAPDAVFERLGGNVR